MPRLASVSKADVCRQTDRAHALSVTLADFRELTLPQPALQRRDEVESSPL